MVARRRRDEARDRARRPPRQRDQAPHARCASDFRPARPEEIEQRLGPPGFIGPVGRAAADPARRGRRRPAGYVTGANRPDAHLRGVEPGRDFAFETRRRPRPSSPATRSAARRSGSSRRSRSATSSSSAPATPSRSAPPTSTSPAPTQLIWMGSYGFGPARAAAAAVEQYADEHGISWPRAIAPFDVELVMLGKRGQRGARAGRPAVRASCRALGLDVLYDDRDAGPGEKFADAELLGCPARVTVGRRTIAAGEIEVQVRRGREARAVPLEGAAEAVAELWRGCPERRQPTQRRHARQAPPVRDRPLRARRRTQTLSGPAAESVDDPERDRVRAAGADPGVPRGRALEPATATTRSRPCCSR